jgi:hypothetical protein
MKPAIIPIFCSLVLVSLTTVGAGHWWSVRKMVAEASREAASSGLATVADPTPQPTSGGGRIVSSPPTSAVSEKVTAPAPDMALQKMLELNQSTLDEVKRLTNENRDLRDQMAETNRDLMKLEFRVDTHSQSFRPLPAGDDRQQTSLDVNRLDSNIPFDGVLPSLDEMLPLPE